MPFGSPSLIVLGLCHCWINCTDSSVLHEPPWYGTVCPVVWEVGGGNPATYPIIFLILRLSVVLIRM